MSSSSSDSPSSSSSSSAVLPYCEGFEVIIAGQLEDAPAHHSRAAQHSDRGEVHGQPSPQQQQQPTGVVGAVLGGDEESKVAKYLDRFVKVANRNIDRMQSTLNTAYNLTVKPFIDRLSDDS